MSDEESRTRESVEAPIAEEDIILERVYVVPLWKVRSRGRGLHRTKKAVRFLRQFIARHMKNPNVKISTSVNEELWKDGIRNPPRRIKVRVVLTRDDTVWVFPPKE